MTFGLALCHSPLLWKHLAKVNAFTQNFQRSLSSTFCVICEVSLITNLV